MTTGFIVNIGSLYNDKTHVYCRVGEEIQEQYTGDIYRPDLPASVIRSFLPGGSLFYGKHFKAGTPVFFAPVYLLGEEFIFYATIYPFG